MAIQTISAKPNLEKFFTVESRIQTCLALFHQALQSKEPIPDIQDLKPLHKEAEKIWLQSNEADYENWQRVKTELNQVFWMDHVLKNLAYLQITDPDNLKSIKILPPALTLNAEEFTQLVQPLMMINCEIYVEGDNCTKKYSHTSLTLFFRLMAGNLSLKPALLSPNHLLTIKIKGDRCIQYTQAEYWMLLSTFPPHVDVIDWSSFDEQTLERAYEANVELRATDSEWYGSFSSDQWLRLRRFLETVLPDSHRDLYIYTNGDFLPSVGELDIAEDRLDLDKDDFIQEMTTLLRYCSKGITVKIRQSQSSFPLIFDSDDFRVLMQRGPQFFKTTHSLHCKNEMVFDISSDFYHFFMKFLSTRRGPLNYPTTDFIDLKEYEKETVEIAFIWFKTKKYPHISWSDAEKLAALVEYIAPGSHWHDATLRFLATKTPSITVEELKTLSWETLIEGLTPYNQADDTSKHAKFGGENYRISWLIQSEWLKSASQDRLHPEDLARPLYVKLNSGNIIPGSLEWLEGLDPLPNLGENSRSNPLLINELMIRNTDQLPLNSLSFQQLSRLFVLFTHLNKETARLKTALHACQTIQAGDTSKTPENYWKDVQDTLRLYPNARVIELEGCPASWPRGAVEAFIAHENITLNDLSEPISIPLVDEKGKTVPYRMYKAEWMCFTSESYLQDWTKKKIIPQWALRAYLNALFEGHFKEGELGEAYLRLEWLASPYCKNKVKTLLNKPTPQPARTSSVPRVKEYKTPLTPPPSLSDRIKEGLTISAFLIPVFAVGVFLRILAEDPQRISLSLKLDPSRFLPILALIPLATAAYSYRRNIASTCQRIQQSWRQARGWQKGAVIIGGIATATLSCIALRKNPALISRGYHSLMRLADASK